MKSLSKTIAIAIIAILISLNSNSAWYDFSNPLSKSCKDIPFDVSEYGYTQSFSKKLKTSILKGQAKGRRDFIGDTFIDEHTGVITSLKRIGKNGKIVTNAELDHVIPLKQFHLAGGCYASKSDKVKFGTDRDNLRLTSTNNNRVKGAKTPAGWTPGASTDAKIKYLETWAKVADKHGYVSSFRMTRIITKYPNAVKWGKRGTKITGGIAVAVFIGPLAAAPFVVDGVIDAGTEVMIISEDPDAYWLGVVSNYEDATSSVVGWTSSSWDATKGWTSSSWDDTKVWSSEAWGTTKDWSSNSWDSTKGWSSNTWDTTKDWSSEVLEGVKGWDSGLNK
jgi:hypothetical protein